MEQVENFEENSDVKATNTSGSIKHYNYPPVDTALKVAETHATYGKKV